LRWELKSRGVDTEIIDNAVAQVPNQTLFEQAERLAQRRLRGKDSNDPKVIAGTYRYLVQRGYDYVLVEEVVQKVLHYLDTDVQNS
jgi:SOS response regulatory protein OraA/RecX